MGIVLFGLLACFSSSVARVGFFLRVFLFCFARISFDLLKGYCYFSFLVGFEVVGSS